MSAEEVAAPNVPIVAAGSPWLGLQSYEEEHSPLFFGREADSNELLRLVKRDVLTVLYGMSGLGKTSLLNAGLFPLLRRHSYLPIPIRLGVGGEGVPEPVVLVREAIAKEIAERCTETRARGEAETLWEYFHRTDFRSGEDRARLLTPVLVFDQFEEVIRSDLAGPGREALYEELSDLIENFIPTSIRERFEASTEELPFRYDSPRAKVIFSLREDYLGQLQELKPLIPSLMRNVLRLKPMSGRQALEAVINPARQVHLVIAEDVAQRIVRISAGEEGGVAEQRLLSSLEELEVEPALLSLFCDELNKTRLARRLPTITAELAQGERGGILSVFYEDRTKSLPPKVKRFIEDELLTKEGHRKPAVEEDLADDVKAEVDTLIDARLLRRETPAGRPSYVELMHDVLAEPIVKSRNERRQQEAVEEERRRQEEVRREASARLKQQRDRTKAFAVAAAICVVLLAIALYSWWRAEGLKTAAETARIEQFAERLAAQANNLAADPDGWLKSALLATESIKLRLTPETSAAWAVAIDRSPREELFIGAPVTAVAFAPDGKRLATASVNGALRVWDVDSRRELVQPEKPQALVTAIAFGPDGRHLVAAGDASVWDVEGAKEVILLRHPVKMTSVALSLDGKRAAGLDSSNLVWVWEIGSGQKLISPLKHLKSMSEVTVVALSADGKRLATAPSGGTAHVWDVDGGKELIQFAELGSPVTAMTFSADGKWLATAHQDLRMRVWDAESGTRLMERDSPNEVTAIAFSPNAQLLATGHRSGNLTARLWDLQSATELRRLLPVETPLASMAFSSNGAQVFAAAADNTMHVWDMKSGVKIKAPPLIAEGTEGLITIVALSADGTRVATASADNKTRVWDVKSGKKIVFEHSYLVTAVALSPDGTRLATGSADKRARVWDWERSNSPTELEHPGSVLAVAFSSDGTRLATSSNDRKARVWDLKRNRGSPIELEHPQQVVAVAFSSDGKRLATAGGDNTARVWDLGTREELVRLPQRKPIRSLAFSPLENRLLTVDFDNVLRALPLTVDEMIRIACSSVTRNLTHEDRKFYLRDERYLPTCSNLPED